MKIKDDTEPAEAVETLTELRHTFNTRSQKADESFQAYLTALRTMAEACEFGDMRDELLKDSFARFERPLNVNLFLSNGLHVKACVEI